ncbi:hypothetical protein AB0D33_29110 [Streptomyces sp. NPDC048404]|uniref:hypothetical protein n=1 Tax=unclassified Streptomyces TaxID=2593676 RepID=UPI00342D0229
MTWEKSRFGPSALVIELNDLTRRIAAGEDPQGLDDLVAMVEERFQLTEGQQTGVRDLASQTDQISRLKELVLDAARSDGASQFVVVQRPNGANGRFVHELRRETLAKGIAPAADEESGVLRATVGIAHCDADCRNWGWGSAKTKEA